VAAFPIDESGWERRDQSILFALQVRAEEHLDGPEMLTAFDFIDLREGRRK